MALRDRLLSLNKRLRVMLLCTALLIVPGIGQFVAIRDLGVTGRESDLAVFFAVVAIFVVPTVLILSTAILLTVRRQWREHQRLIALGATNLFIALNITWFFAHPCSWAQVFGLVLRICH